MSYLDNAYGMRDIHQLLLDMVTELDAVCRKHGIEYSLLGGTMLGAVRHGGFIPWDDDIDLVFTKEALSAFCRVFPQESERYTIVADETWLVRVVPKTPINGMRPFLDLFHYEPITKSKAGQRAKVLLLQLLQGMLKEDADYTRFSLKNRMLLKTTHGLGRLFSKQTKLRLYRWVGSHVAVGDDSLLHISDERFDCLHLTYPAAYSTRFEDVAFEGQTLRMARDFHQMLTIHYGDYMTPPPEGERKSKHDGQRQAKGEPA